MAKQQRPNTLARIAHVERLLFQAGARGLSVQALADNLDVSKRSAERYLNTISVEDIFPVWHENGRCGVVTSRYLPPIRFEPAEALYVFIASRLMAGFEYRHDADIGRIFEKLNCVMPEALVGEIGKTLAWMKKLPSKPRLSRVISQLAAAWLGGHSALIEYKSLAADRFERRLIDPYYIQPSLAGHSCYIIAHCHKAGAVRVFKAERIHSVMIQPDAAYRIPASFDANEYLSAAWGIVTDEDVQSVVLRVDPSLARLAEETTWHPSQSVERQPDGSVRLAFQVSLTPELSNWIMGWGARMEVLAPAGLRREMAGAAVAMAGLYGREN